MLLAITLTFWVAAATHEHRHWPSVLAVAYVFLLGIGRAFLRKDMGKVVSHQANLLILIEFLVLIVAEISPLSLIENNYNLDRLVSAGLLGLFLIIVVVALAPREWTPPADCPAFVQGKEIQPAKEDTCSLFDYYCTFGRVSGLIGKGWNGNVTMSEFDDLPWNYRPEVLYPQISELRRKHKTTAKAIFMYIRREIFVSILLAGAWFSFELSVPFALYQLLEYLSNPQDAIFQPYLWLFVMFAGSILESVTQQAFTFVSTRATIKLKMALTTEMYQKAITSRELEDNFLDDKPSNANEPDDAEEKKYNKSSSGQLANIMSTDIETIQEGRIVLITLFGAPVGIIVALIGMYNIVGWPCLVGVGIMLMLSPLPAWIVSHASGQQSAAKSAQDSRISLATEYLSSIRVIKYFGWEDAAAKNLRQVRAKEQKYLWNISLLYTAMGEAASVIPVFSIVAIYSLYVGVRTLPLTASMAFTTIRLMDILRNNFSIMAWSAMFIPRISISIRRLNRFYAAATPPEEYPEGPLRVENATFRRNKKSEFILRDITIDFVQGGLNAITGPSGSGKTTLLLSIIGETMREGGSVTRPRDVAFASQTPWLQAQSIRDNVTFNSPYNILRYRAVLDACCLDLDLDELPEGDVTDIGENGSALSGTYFQGQPYVKS